MKNVALRRLRLASVADTPPPASGLDATPDVIETMVGVISSSSATGLDLPSSNRPSNPVARSGSTSTRVVSLSSRKSNESRGTAEAAIGGEEGGVVGEVDNRGDEGVEESVAHDGVNDPRLWRPWGNGETTEVDDASNEIIWVALVETAESS